MLGGNEAESGEFFFNLALAGRHVLLSDTYFRQAFEKFLHVRGESAAFFR